MTGSVDSFTKTTDLTAGPSLLTMDLLLENLDTASWAGLTLYRDVSSYIYGCTIHRYIGLNGRHLCVWFGLVLLICLCANLNGDLR